MSDLKPLSKKHQRFVAEYLKSFNGTRAYMAVYPKSSYEAAMVSASELLRNPKVSEAIDTQKNNVLMQADEAMRIMSEIARGDIGDFMSVNSMGFELDMQAAREAEKTGIIKRVRQTVITVNGEKEDKETITTDIELHDKLAAVRDVLKIHGKFGASVELSEGVEIVIRKASDVTAGTNNK
jgi:phage terminase small subunit